MIDIEQLLIASDSRVDVAEVGMCYTRQQILTVQPENFWVCTRSLHVSGVNTRQITLGNLGQVKAGQLLCGGI